MLSSFLLIDSIVRGNQWRRLLLSNAASTASNRVYYRRKSITLAFNNLFCDPLKAIICSRHGQLIKVYFWSFKRILFRIKSELSHFLRAILRLAREIPRHEDLECFESAIEVKLQRFTKEQDIIINNVLMSECTCTILILYIRIDIIHDSKVGQVFLHFRRLSFLNPLKIREKRSIWNLI